MNVSKRQWQVSLLVGVLCTAGGAAARADAVTVPNYSFESPLAPRVSPFAMPAFSGSDTDDWIESPMPFWWPATIVEWNQSAGVFFNVPGLQHINNADGEQVAYMFAVPDMGITQDLAATYEVNRSYELRVALRGGSGGMPLGSPVEVSLYYRNGANNIVSIGATEFLNDNTGSPTSLVDVVVNLPPVMPGDAWAGKNIGIQIRSSVALNQPELQAGTWGIDNVRLNSENSSVPAASTWGLLIMTLALIILGTVSGRKLHAET